MNNLTCPTRKQLASFSTGQLEEDLALQIGEHLDVCESCRDLMETISDVDDTYASALGRPAPRDEYEDESAFKRAVSLIQAIGREPSFTGQQVVVDAHDAGLGDLGHYRLLAKLGEGGMGAVYKALHTNLNRVVAIKVLPSDRLENEAAVSRFRREMTAVGKLQHPNIVVAHDAGQIDGTHYLVMELVDGLDLSTLVRRVGPALPLPPGEGRGEGLTGMSVADACEMIRQAATGLQEAHEDGMVHRDIKPSNLMLARSRKGRKPPLVKILDLGLALLDDQRSERRDLTSTGQMMGTLDYMAPEQGMDSHEVDIRADIYSLGATLYKLLSGQAPFPSNQYDTPVKMLMALATKQAPSIASLRNDLPAELVAIVDRMLARSPDDRFSEPEEVAEALTPFCDGSDLTALLKAATGEDTESPEDESAVATHESLKSDSVETAPTIEAPVGPDGPAGPVTTEPTTTSQAPDGLAGPPATEPRPKSDTATEGIAAREKANPTTLAKAALGTVPAGPSGPTAKSRRWYTNRRNQVLIAAGLAGVVLLAAITLLVRTKHGTIVVEFDDPRISVTVNGEDILISDPTVTVDPSSDTHKQAGQPIKLRPGEHTLHITYGDLEFDTDKFRLRRGEEVVLTVRIAKDEVQVVQRAEEQTVIGRRQKPKGDYALAFDGESSYVEIPQLQIGIDHPITLEAVVRYDGRPSERACVISGSYLPRPALYYSDYDGWSFTKVLATRAQKLYISEPVTKRDIHIAAVLTGQVQKLFIDGKLQDAKIDARYVVASTKDESAGSLIGVDFRQERLNDFFHGIIDEVRISSVARYDKDFTPAERFEPDEHTLALYHFDEGQGEIAHDSSPNKHHGKIVGAKWVKVEGAEASHFSPSDLSDKDVANWMLSIGGKVRINNSEDWIQKASDLPQDGKCIVTGVSFHQAKQITNSDLRRLSNLSDLNHLGLPDQHGVDDEGLVHFSKMRSLKTVVLVGIGVRGSGLRFLSSSALERLDVGWNLTDEALEHIGKAKELQELNFRSCREVTDAGVACLADLENLTRLVLVCPNVTDAGVQHLSKLHELEYLNLDGTQISGDCFDVLKELPRLTFLCLNNTNLSELGYAKLSQFRKLNGLQLNDTETTDKDIRPIIERLWPSELGLSNTKITDETLRLFTTGRLFTTVGLRQWNLVVVGTSVTVEGVAAAKKANPRPGIQSDFTDEAVAAAIEKLKSEEKKE